MSQIEPPKFSITDLVLSDGNIAQIDAALDQDSVKWIPKIKSDKSTDEKPSGELSKIGKTGSKDDNDKDSEFDAFFGDEDDYFATGGTVGSNKKSSQKTINLKSFGFSDDENDKNDETEVIEVTETISDLTMKIDDIMSNIESIKEDVEKISDRQKVTNDRLKRILEFLNIPIVKKDKKKDKDTDDISL